MPDKPNADSVHIIWSFGRLAWRHRILVALLITTSVYACQFALLKIPDAYAAYTIASSARFNDDDSAYLSRTPASAGNRRTWTLSAWIKRGNLGVVSSIYSAAVTSGCGQYTIIGSDGRFYMGDGCSGTYPYYSDAFYRDPAAWMHIVLAVDTTQASLANRIRLYVNNVEQSGTRNISQNADMNFNYTTLQAVAATVITTGPLAGYYGDEYIADMHMIDGQQLTPSSFGETDANGYWRPKAYTGTYGTNGFKLDFANSADLGNDVSGNNNDWTVNNLDATDQVIDTPTNGFGTWNPLYKGTDVSLSQGNTGVSVGTTNYGSFLGNFCVLSGKWYWEVTPTSGAAGFSTGVVPSTVAGVVTSGVGAVNLTNVRLYLSGGGKRLGPSTDSSYGASFTDNDVIGVALDMDAGTVTFYKNNASQGEAFNGLSGYMCPVGQDGSNGDALVTVGNFGQGGQSGLTYDSASGGYFKYTPPSGFKALSTANLPEPAVVVPKNYFDAVLYTGNASTNAITGLGFQPNLVWIKNRTDAASHALFDAVRGVQKFLSSNSTAAEDTDDTQSLSSFDSTGFSLGTGGSTANVNTASKNYVAWLWKESTTSGFDIVTYTGNGSNRTVAHSLGVAPSMIIVKNRDNANNWNIFHSANTAAPETDYLQFTTAATADLDTMWNDTAPNASVFSLGTSAGVNTNAQNYIAYLFAEVPGFSKFGSYTGNGSTDGPFVYTGFKPKFLMWKNTGAATDWQMVDAARDTYDPRTLGLYPDSSGAESAWGAVDFLSNGFKIRSTVTSQNGANTIIYAAFAEQPFKYSAAPAELAAGINAGTTFLMGMEI